MMGGKVEGTGESVDGKPEPRQTLTVRELRREVEAEYALDSELAAEVTAIGVWRPKLRGHCEPCPECQAENDDPSYQRTCRHSEAETLFHCRPCPFVGCRHHLYLETAHDTGSLHFNHPTKEPAELKASCALDAAMRGGLTLDQVGFLFGITRERIRQIESRVLRVLRLRRAAELGVFHEGD